MENPFKGRHFQADIILICTRWYLRYALSYRDIEEMMTERGLSVDHTTIYRWVQEYAPELDKRSPYPVKTHSSWIRASPTHFRTHWPCKNKGPERLADHETASFRLARQLRDDCWVKFR